MSKFVNITVSTSMSTDFYIEVPDDANEEQIKELAKKEVVLPNDYPTYINNLLRDRLNLQINGIDSLFKDWNIDELTYIVENAE